MGVEPMTRLLGPEKNQLSFFLVLLCVLSLNGHLPIRGYTGEVGKLYQPWRQVTFTKPGAETQPCKSLLLNPVCKLKYVLVLNKDGSTVLQRKI